MVHRMTFLMKAISIVLILICLYDNSLEAKPVTVNVININNQPVGGIVIYLTNPDGETVNYEGSEVTVYQQDKKFQPYISVKSVKDQLVFENKDSIRHHIYTVLSNDFDFPLQQNERLVDKQINEAGQVLMACNIHDWMAGYIVTVDTPYYGKTNAKGSVVIDVAENKNYTANIWHPQLAKTDLSLKKLVELNNANEITFQLTEKMGEIPTQENDEIFDFLDDY